MNIDVDMFSQYYMLNGGHNVIQILYVGLTCDTYTTR